MKYVLRLIALLAVVALLSGTLSGCSQPPIVHYDLAEVIKMEDTQEAAKTLEAYANVMRENVQPGKDRKIAVEAAWRAAQFAAGDKYGKVDEQNLRKRIHVEDPNQVPEDVRELRERMRADGEHKAHEALKQLLKEFPDAPIVGAAKQLKKDLEDRIDKRNSTYTSYKLVDSLVAMTGRSPAFSYWFALALIAVIVKLITLPLTLKMYKSQREMQRLQPILKELQEKYKDDRVALNQKMMDVYKEHGVSPFASCLPMLIQLPFMIWIYNTIRLYEFHFSNGLFFWIGSPLAARYPEFLATNLAQFDFVLLVIYAGSNYLTMKLTPPADPQQAQQQKSMAVMMTAMMFWMFMQYRWSAAFIWYWLVLNAISAYQQYTYIYKKRPSEPGAPGASGGGGGGRSSLKPIVVTSSGASGKTGSTNGANGNRPNTPTPPVTPIPGGSAPKPRPRRKKR